MSQIARITSASNAVPADRLPPEGLADARTGTVPIDFTLLRQQPVAAHRIDAGDTLAVYIEGITAPPREQEGINRTDAVQAMPVFDSLVGTRDPFPATGLIRRRLLGCLCRWMIPDGSCCRWLAHEVYSGSR